jgi:hypothetical protein
MRTSPPDFVASMPMNNPQVITIVHKEGCGHVVNGQGRDE